MSEHYAILGVNTEASPRDIKSAFRKKAKIHHPDSKHGTADSMRLVLEAYRILSDPVLRREYDRGKLRIIPNSKNSAFDYRLWLKERLEKPEYVAKLIFYDLLHGFEDEALSLYDKIRDVDDARMERFFERNESMDAEYCIAEEYIKRGRFEDGFFVFSKLIRMEQQTKGFGYFYEVVLLSFKKLVLENFPRVLDSGEMLEMLEKAIKLVSSKENNVSFLKKKAEILFKAGRLQEASEEIKKADFLNPKMADLKSFFKKRIITFVDDSHPSR